MHLAEIGKHWRKGEQSRMIVAEYVALDCQTSEDFQGTLREIAVEIRQSVRTAERLFFAGMLLIAVKRAETMDFAPLRDLGYLQWAELGWRVSKDEMDIDTAAEWLKRSYEENWSVDRLRAELPSLTVVSEFGRDVSNLARKMERQVINAPRINFPEPDGSRIVRFGKAFVESVKRYERKKSRGLAQDTGRD